MNANVIQKNNNTIIYYWHGASLMLLNNLQTDFHKHYPVEIYVGLDHEFEIDFGQGWEKRKSVVIASNQVHKISSCNNPIAIIILDPMVHNIGAMQKSGAVNDCKLQLKEEYTSTIIDTLKKIQAREYSSQEAIKFTKETIETVFASNRFINKQDSRLITVFNLLEDMKCSRVSMYDISKAVNLSESRISHIFKMQTGSSIQSYISWLKLKQTIKNIMYGQSFTTALYECGFSDSAHFSRTYKKMFGASPSTFLKKYQDIEIVLSSESD